MELKPTAKVAETLALAQRAAQTAGHPEITPDHLTSALIQLDTAQADALLQAAGTGWLLAYVAARPPDDDALPELRRRMGATTFQQAWVRGAAMTRQHAVAYALQA